MASDVAELYLAKALESLAGAESEFANQRYNNCANRCYYACFQAAITALIGADIRPPRVDWEHDFMRSQFVGLLINRRKLYTTSIRGTLTLTTSARITADYEEVNVSSAEASRALRGARGLVNAVEARGGGRT